MSGDIPRIADRREWLARAREASATLQNLPMSPFYDPATGRYHPVVEEIEALVWSLETDIEAFRAFLDRNPQTKAWLPKTAQELDGMAALEIKFRIGENAADERWADGALVEPFQSGVLKAALDRLIADFDTLSLTQD
jgi:hypothetical protein